MTLYITESTEEQAAILIQKIKHYLITTNGRVLEEAHDDEFYRALCYAIREQIMVNWRATAQTWMEKNSRLIFYLSMEYLPGRFLYNNLANLKNLDVIKLVLKKTGRTLNEIAQIEYDPGLGNGGLGRLASCFLDSLATLKMPARGYGLRYQYGLFEQQLIDGVQVEKPDLWLVDENPWLFRRNTRRIKVKFCGTPVQTERIGDTQVYDLDHPEEVWAFPFDVPIVGYSDTPDFSVVTLRLWSTKESPRNFELQRYNAGRLDQAAENTTLTDVLYPTDIHDVGKRIRLKQEFLMVSASLQDIFRYYFARHDTIRDFADKVRIQINDTHPALLIAELMRQLTNYYNMSWKDAWEITQACTSYTNHTILSEALEQWDQGLVRYLLPRQYQIIERINLEFCTQIRKHFPGDEQRVQKMSIIENNMVRMAHLAICGSHKVNGVAALHTDILKKSVFKNFYEMYPDKFVNVTNGVTHRRWLLDSNPGLADFITKRIGKGWILDFSQIRKLAEFAQDEESQNEFLQIKQKNKARLLGFLQHQGCGHDPWGNFVPASLTLGPDALFDVQAKRVHEYKRQLLNALHIIMRYQEIKENPNGQYVKRIVFFGGKAAASYETAKTIIRLICCLAKKINNDKYVNKFLNVHFVENYNVSRAEVLIPACDLSEQISTAGMEASGTGNMKFAMNGALTIGTDDGANVEMRQEVTDKWWPFCFGASSDEIAEMRQNHSYSAWRVYQSNPKIKKAVDALRDRSLVSLDIEHQSLSSLYYTLLEGQNADRFFVLHDLESYYEMQKKVDALYVQPNRWAEYAIHNIAGMHTFTTDRSIQEYCSKIWELQACPIDPALYERVRLAYLESTPSSLI
jgi:glycogen phosphorylase